MELPSVINLENGIRMVKIPKGNGVIGVNGFFQKPLFKPQIEVRIRHDYYLSETPVTSRQWKSLGLSDPSRFPNDDTPVESVSRRKALDFVSKMNTEYPTLDGIKGEFGLPTEAEWEYAARAGDRTKRPGPDYSFGGSNITSLNLHEQGSLEQNYIAKGHKPRSVVSTTANSWGLKGMMGDVAEHCADPYIETNTGVPIDGSVRKGKGMMINGVEHWSQRGGSFDISPKQLNYYWKAGIDMNEADARDGIRLAWRPRN